MLVLQLTDVPFPDNFETRKFPHSAENAQDKLVKEIDGPYFFSFYGDISKADFDSMLVKSFANDKSYVSFYMFINFAVNK